MISLSAARRFNRHFGTTTLVGLVAALLLGTDSCPATGDDAARPPNIVLIVADDLGYGELGVQGGTDIPTPNIDSIARHGVRCTQGYVSCPVCSPTRAGLLSGRYQQRFGHEFNPGPPQAADEAFGLPPDQVTLSERLKSLGYATGMFGKWHLGFRPELRPTHRGFDEFFGFLGGAHSYLPGGRRNDEANPILRGDTAVREPAYLTEAFAREAVTFIEKHRSEPFFVYLPFNAVHAPLQATEINRGRFESIREPRRRTFAAMLSAMDDAVGRVLASLRESDLEKQTLVFFISDNGGPTPITTSRNDPLRGFKGQVFEGGIRVPFMVQWKGQLPEGKIYEQPVISLDLHATAVAAAGAEISPDWKLDGVNLLPYLRGEKSEPPHERLYWRYGEQHAIRQGDWKLLSIGGSSQLFNLAEDVSEKTDRAGEHPDKVQELTDAWQEWNSQLQEPRWHRRAARGLRGNRQAIRRGRRIP